MSKHYNIAFVGLGSIAKRHIKNVCNYVLSCGNTFSIDLYRSSIDRPIAEEILPFVDKSYLYSGEVQRDYDMVFITNPTSLHLEAALKFRPHTKALFIEKPVFDGFDVDEDIINTLDEIPTYVACPLHYNPAQFALNMPLIHPDHNLLQFQAQPSDYIQSVLHSKTRL